MSVAIYSWTGHRWLTWKLTVRMWYIGIHTVYDIYANLVSSRHLCRCHFLLDKNMKICIQNSTLSCEETVKLLVIEIDYQLNFDIHISSICKKASHQLNILKRLGRYLDRLSKLTIFHTFILSNFNFCPLAWRLCTDKNSKKIEKVQERALRFVYDDYTSSYINLLTEQI